MRSNYLIKKQKNKSTRPFSFSVAALLSLEVSYASSDLNTTINKALETNPEILLQKSEKEATQYKLDQEFGNYLPSVQVQGGAGKEYVRQSFRRNALNSPVEGSVNSTRFNPSLRIIQRLFDGLETPNRVSKARKEIIQSDKNVEEALVLTAFDAIDKYISVRRFDRLIKLAKENVNVHKNILGKINTLVKAGKLADSDAKNAEARLRDAEAALQDIQGDYDTAVASFIEVVGVKPENLKRPFIDHSLLPKTLEEAVSIAIQKNRSIMVADATVNVAKADYDTTIAPFMPSLNLQFDANRDFNVGGKKGIQNDVVGQVVASFNVFNGGKDLGKRREYRAKIISAKLRKDKEQRRAEKETRVSWGEMMSARNQSVALAKAVQAKRQVRDIYMQQFDGGTRSFLDILDASHEYFLAKGSEITANATEDLASARVMASMGILLDMFRHEKEADTKKPAKATDLKIVSNTPSSNKTGYSPRAQGTQKQSAYNAQVERLESIIDPNAGRSSTPRTQGNFQTVNTTGPQGSTTAGPSQNSQFPSSGTGYQGTNPSQPSTNQANRLEKFLEGEATDGTGRRASAR